MSSTIFFLNFFSVRLLSVLRGLSVFHPRHNGQSISDFIHYIYCPILILEKEPVFSLLNVQCLNKSTTGTIFLLRLWYDAFLDWGLNPGPPALEASTIPLGYRAGGSTFE